MSDVETYDDDDYQPETEPQGRNPLRARMKQLEAEAAELRKQNAEAEAARRELAFLKAGVDLDNPMSKYFVKGYEGPTDPDAIRQAAIEAQLIAPDNPVNTDEQAAWGRTTKVAANSQTAEPPVDWATRLAEASSEAEVMAILAEAQANQ